MRALRTIRVALAMLGVLMAAPVAQARHRAEAIPAGDFDYFLLSLSVAPSFCSLSPGNQAKQECQLLTGTDFQRTPLTLHGLWPNRAGVSVNRQPHDCEGPPFTVSDAVQADLRRTMPGGPGLARYEWRKHGTCSGLSSEAYFGTMARLAQRANETIGAAMRDQHMLGRTVRIADLLKAAAERDQALDGAIVVDCRSPRGGGEALIDEIRIVLSKDFRPIAASGVGMGQNSGCPGGAGRLPEGLE
jgi:ribonuclease T2